MAEEEYGAEKIIALEGSIRGPKGTFISVPGLTKSKLELLGSFRLERELDLFSKMYNPKTLQTRQLRKAVQDWDRLISKNPLLLLTQKQHDVIMGTLLGDANVKNRGKNSIYRTGHSDKQSLYVYWLQDIFAEFTNDVFYIRTQENRLPDISFQTYTHPVFNFYYDLFYRTGKKAISKEILNQLTPQSLAVWICDDGCYSKTGNYLILCTNSFTLEEHNLMKEYFKTRWNLNPTISFRDKKYYYLRFIKRDTEKLVNLIRNFIPTEDMMYKIGEKNV